MKAADVRALLAAGARVARDAAIVPRLVASTGLSRENVEIGLARHLETSASDAEIDALVAAAGRASSVGVVLSASVFVAPLRAIALALAASDRVVVKPSRREPFFATALVAELADPRVTIGDPLAGFEGGTVGVARLDVYGRDETIASVRRAAGPGVQVRGHGAGIGVALVGADASTFARAAGALAEDVTAFDQRGCLSPRVAFVVGDAGVFARALSAALETRAALVPRGALAPDEREAFARWSATVAYAGDLHQAASSAVGVLDSPALPPTGRNVLVRPLRAPTDFPAALGDLARFVTSIGTDLPFELVRSLAPPHARLADLGAMQRPPLDGPVDRRPP